MDLKISDTNKGKKSLIYDGFIYRIDGVLKCGDISWRWGTAKSPLGQKPTRTKAHWTISHWTKAHCLIWQGGQKPTSLKKVGLSLL